MNKNTTEPPHRLQLHFCRTCGEPFIDGKGEGSPHAQVWKHMIEQHEASRDKDYQSCSRYCDQRAQAEEVKRGRRLYGADVPHASAELRATYDRLFPEDSP